MNLDPKSMCTKRRVTQRNIGDQLSTSLQILPWRRHILKFSYIGVVMTCKWSLTLTFWCKFTLHPIKIGKKCTFLSSYITVERYDGRTEGKIDRQMPDTTDKKTEWWWQTTIAETTASGLEHINHQSEASIPFQYWIWKHKGAYWVNPVPESCTEQILCWAMLCWIYELLHTGRTLATSSAA